MANIAATYSRSSARHHAFEQCIESCAQCSKACMELVLHCLERGSEHAAPEHIRLLLDCSSACDFNSKLLMRRSEFHALFCRACAEVCLRCAEDCTRFQDDEAMIRCADLCRICADACEQMAKSI